MKRTLDEDEIDQTGNGVEEEGVEEGKEDNSGWLSLLEKTRVLDLSEKKKRDLVIIEESSTLKQTLHLLQKENILSVPMVSKTGLFMCIVDVLDIASIIYHEWRHVSVELDHGHFPDDKFFDLPISEVLHSKGKNTTFVNTTDNLLSVIHAFKSPETGHRLHRVAVLDSNKMVDVISQSDIINFVEQNISLLPKNVAEKTAEELKIIHSPLMLTVDTTVSDALLTLCRNKVSGIALVDSEYKLVGNLSASDLRGIQPTCFEFFTGSVLQFLSVQASGAKPTKFVKENTKLKDIIKEIVEYKIHRIFVTTDVGFPKGVISLIDIISVL